MAKDEEKLKDLYTKAAGLNEELPGDLLQKLKIYGDILSITGKLHASALSDWKMSEAIRKETIAKCFTFDPEGTAKEREMKAEFAASDHRKNEAQAEAACMRWKNAYNSTSEIINILKIQLRDMKDIDKGGI
ncbi:hypothetical protein [Bacillus pseudomycoides]|uniref:hypothetical protein n=1 Tax=Bacillus pseudomycoides TaxID=64104 RepID=UPI000BECD9E9|nr:hypothetical protein [Bacillus pseudomycoides]PEE42826.1 hypothetical protein COO02_05765 [Bacillus pseudomycoides]PEI42553.1 hypothetical protein CN620_08850 [Bacillus pseudomycoides]PGA90866.1 hypothetical protein COL91_12190 [Bacillus pseudomycoides]PGD26789.1 hypothetical protein COM32_12865 [Bacillus pseudomycoides]PHG24712.1 hypothetical protein COI47_07940 [Bacillus pseudomycoides]